MSNFKCAYQGSFFVCVPLTTSVKESVRVMQRAADALLAKLPFFITWTENGKVVILPTSPIASSKSKIDGVVGPFTASMVQLALVGAIELRNQTEGLTKVPSTILSAAKELREQERVQKIAYNTSEIAAFLAAATEEFEVLLAAIKEKERVGALKLPVTLQPAPVDRGVGLEVPPGTAALTKQESGSRWWLWALLGGAAATGVGVILYKSRKKKRVVRRG